MENRNQSPTGILYVWRTELFKFRAFKFAVKKLLDTLEEPPELSSLTTEEERKQAAKNVAENFGAEFSKLISEIHRSPEAMGGWVFGNIWTRFTKSDLPFSEAERRMIRKQPVLGSAMEREHRGFQKARKALELKSDRLQETLEHIRKTGKKLSPQMEEALKRISKAVGLPHIEDVMELLEQTEKLKVKNPKG